MLHNSRNVRRNPRWGFTARLPCKLTGLVFLIMLGAGHICMAQETIGRVYKLQGTWYRDGLSRPLTSNDAVPAGAVIRIQSPSRLDFIVFLLANGEVFEKRCSRGGECDQPIQLPRSVEQRYSIWTIIEPVVGLFRRNPAKYSVAMPKSGTDTLKETVVEAKNGTADFAAVFGEMIKGTYAVRLERKSGRGQASSKRPGSPVIVRWDPGGPSSIPFSGLRPGIYEVRLLEERGNKTYLPTPVTAWVLVSDPRHFEQAMSDFDRALTLTAAWDKKVDEGSIRGFLRAYLDHLSIQQNETR